MTVLAHALSDCLKHGMSLEQCPPVPRLTKRAQSLTELAPALTEGESELPLWGPDRACSVTYRARSVLSDQQGALSLTEYSVPGRAHCSTDRARSIRESRCAGSFTASMQELALHLPRALRFTDRRTKLLH